LAVHEKRSVWVEIRLVAELQIGTHELQIGAATLTRANTNFPAKMVVLIAGGVLTPNRLRRS
jgi:hypothetical protein